MEVMHALLDLKLVEFDTGLLLADLEQEGPVHGLEEFLQQVIEPLGEQIDRDLISHLSDS